VVPKVLPSMSNTREQEEQEEPFSDRTECAEERTLREMRRGIGIVYGIPQSLSDDAKRE
jgi:hypothetical protein